MTALPNILAIETSSRSGSIALATGPTLLVEHPLPPEQRHAAELMPAIDRLTREAGWTPADIQHLSLSIGPGSFTGLRIAVALARSLAHALGTKIVAVPSLDVIAENAPADFATVLPLLDAKRGQVFTALYTRTPAGALTRATDQHLTTPADILEQALSLAAPGSAIALLGEGLDYHPLATDNPRLVKLPKPLWPPRAATVHRLGYALARQNAFTDPATLLPTYIRLPEAEEVYRKKHNLPL
jgi:tRNA threonylcarbamoyladenosine biosynthesis protein TsaB